MHLKHNAIFFSLFFWEFLQVSEEMDVCLVEDTRENDRIWRQLLRELSSFDVGYDAFDHAYFSEFIPLFLRPIDQHEMQVTSLRLVSNRIACLQKPDRASFFVKEARVAMILEQIIDSIAENLFYRGENIYNYYGRERRMPFTRRADGINPIIASASPVSEMARHFEGYYDPFIIKGLEFLGSFKTLFTHAMIWHSLPPPGLVNTMIQQYNELKETARMYNSQSAFGILVKNFIIRIDALFILFHNIAY